MYVHIFSATPAIISPSYNITIGGHSTAYISNTHMTDKWKHPGHERMRYTAGEGGGGLD